MQLLLFSAASFLGPHQQMLAELYCFQLICLSVRQSVVTNSVIFIRISSKCHRWIVSFNLSFKFASDNKDGRRNGRHLSLSAVVVTLTQLFLIGFLPNFIYKLLPSTFHSK